MTKHTGSRFGVLAYVAFAVVWGSRLLGDVVGDGATLAGILLVVHLGAGAWISAWWAPLLALIPIAIAVVTGSDLVDPWGYLVYLGFGAALLLAAGVLVGRVTRRRLRPAGTTVESGSGPRAQRVS